VLIALMRSSIRRRVSWERSLSIVVVYSEQSMTFILHFFFGDFLKAIQK
jgi:hypothetical protein